MDETPKRRWFRFRLSTVLILTAIAAWVMASRPYVIVTTHQIWSRSPPPAGTPFSLSPLTSVDVSDLNIELGDTISQPKRLPWRRTYIWLDHRRTLNLRLTWPALALSAFLAWKAAWAVVEHRRSQSASPE